MGEGAAMSFADALNLAMDRAGMNQSAVIIRTGISQASMSQYQTGRRKPDLDSFAKLCAALPELVAWFASSVYDRAEAPPVRRADRRGAARANAFEPLRSKRAQRPTDVSGSEATLDASSAEGGVDFPS